MDKPNVEFVISNWKPVHLLLHLLQSNSIAFDKLKKNYQIENVFHCYSIYLFGQMRFSSSNESLADMRSGVS